MIKRFPTGEPSTLSEVYEHARTLELAQEWFLSSQQPSSSTRFAVAAPSSRSKPSGVTQNQKEKDDDLESWGRARKGEGPLYKRKDRCMKCDKKAYSDPNHPCRQKLRQFSRLMPQKRKAAFAGGIYRRAILAV